MNVDSQNISQLVIDGSDIKNESSEITALSKFYKAFNNQDMLLMEQSWLNTTEISMDNPIGGIRRVGKKLEMDKIKFSRVRQKYMWNFMISQFIKLQLCFLQRAENVAISKQIQLKFR